MNTLQVSLGESAVVTLMVRSKNASSERRFPRAMRIGTLKERLEPITGVSAGHIRLKLFGEEGEVVHLDDDEKMLGYYGARDYMTMEVLDTNPVRMVDFEDLGNVQKYEMEDEAYDKLRDTVRAFKKRNKIGRFSEQSGCDSVQERDDHDEVVSVQNGDRCKVAGDGYDRVGTVRYVGRLGSKKGIWVGVECDEPVGRHDGSFEGEKIFSCGEKRGLFVRPDKVVVGDFAEEDYMDEF